MADKDDPGYIELAARAVSGDRDRGQRTFYNNTRAGLLNSKTATEEGSTYGGVGHGLSVRRKLQGYDAEDISKHFRE